MKTVINVKGWSSNLHIYVTRWYFNDEIKKTKDGILCVAHRYCDNPRFDEGEYTLTPLKEVVS